MAKPFELTNCIGFRYILFFGIGVCNLIVVVADWVTYYCDGHLTLWQECTSKSNATFCDEREDDEGRPLYQKCTTTTTKGPVWLEICRTMACLTIPLFLMMAIGFHNLKNLESPAHNLIGHFKIRLPIICYFLNGVMLVATTLLYHAMFKDHYEEEGVREDISLGPSPIVGFVGGIISLLNAISLNCYFNSGFKDYFVKKTGCCKSQSTTDADDNNSIEVKSSCGGFNFWLKKCFEKCKKRETAASTSATVNTITMQTNQMRRVCISIETQTGHCNDDTRGGSTVGRGWFRQNNAPNFFIVGEDNPPRYDSRPASSTDLNIQVLSLSETINNTTTPNRSSRTSERQRSPIQREVLTLPSYDAVSPPPLYSPGTSQQSLRRSGSLRQTEAWTVPQYDYDAVSPPPSYEEATRNDTSC